MFKAFFPATLCLTLIVASMAKICEANTQPRFKILHIMSYHSPWRWTDSQLQGFREGLGVTNVDIRVFQMDTKHNSTETAKQEKAKQAIAIIHQWQPDLVYTTDDDAQALVAKRFINAPVPFVFSGVNKSPASYGFNKSHNITGVVEHEHFVASVKLLQSISPNIRRLALVFDDAAMWQPTQERIRARLNQLENISIAAWDTILTFEEFKAKITSYQSQADAIALIGIFNFKDEEGNNVPFQTVLKWVTENSNLPDFGFWLNRVHYGTLAAVTVSGYEQGFAAGTMARTILVDGVTPSDITPRATTKGEPVINLARAQKLGIKINSTLLLSTQIVQRFEWLK